MNKICIRNQCNNPSIYRGKYCEEHRSHKKKTNNERDLRMRLEEQRFEELIKISLEEEKKRLKDEDTLRILQNRELLEEQRKEYEKCEKIDKETFQNQRMEERKQKEEELRIKEDEDMKKILKISEMESKTQKYHDILNQIFLNNNDQDMFRIKVQIKNKQNILQFLYYHTCEDIYNYIDVLLYENNIHATEGFELIHYPNHVMSRNTDQISSIGLAHNSVLVIKFL